MTLEEASRLWRDVLTSGRDVAPTEAVILDLMEYSGLAEAEVRAIATRTLDISNEKWSETKRHSAEDLIEFYRSVSNWVFGHMHYHAKQAEMAAAGDHPYPVLVAAQLAHLPPGDQLDFGAGVGTAGLLFARLGWRQTVSDVSPPLLEFARWRYQRRGIDARFIDLTQQSIGENRYDLITAFNTFAHVPDPLATLRDMRRALKPGGLLVFDVDIKKPTRESGWFLFDTPAPFIQPMRALGFAAKPSIGPMFVYQRTETPAWKRGLYGAVDSVLQSGPAWRLRAWRRRQRQQQKQRDNGRASVPQSA